MNDLMCFDEYFNFHLFSSGYNEFYKSKILTKHTVRLNNRIIVANKKASQILR